MLYKLTDEDYESLGRTLWGPGVTHRAKKGAPILCSDTVIHAYRAPELARLFNPIHGAIHDPICWGCPDEEIVGDNGLKVGTKQLTTIRIVEMPIFTSAQLIRFATYCVLLRSTSLAWQTWAEDWLSGKDRSVETAYVAAAAIATTRLSEAAWAATLAAEAAAKAAAQTTAETEIALWTARTAAVIAAGSSRKQPIDFLALIRKAVVDEQMPE